MKFPKELVAVPEAYFEEANEKGKVERIDYKTSNFDGRDMDKHAYVYTPYGYDENKEYEILYLIHGGGELAEKYLYQSGEENALKRIVDNMIEKGEINPVIIVTPCQYPDNTIPEKGVDYHPYVNHFPTELVVDLLPAVESKYSTFAKDVTPQGLIDSREHRAVMGWSLGSTTCWTVFLQCPEYFNRAGILSGQGGCPILGDTSIEDYQNRTVNETIKLFKKQNRKPEDFYLFMATGTKDQAYPNLTPQAALMHDHPEFFIFDGDKQNCVYLVWPDGEHHTPWRLLYTYNEIKAFFERG